MSISPRYAFAWATGHNVALGSLNVLEVELYTYTKPQIIAPLAEPIDPFPVRTTTHSGRVYGDGFVNTRWEFASLLLPAWNYILDTYLTVGSSEVAERAVTIFTLRRFPNTYARYNAYLQYPILNEDYIIRDNRAQNIRLRFNDLTVI